MNRSPEAFKQILTELADRADAHPVMDRVPAVRRRARRNARRRAGALTAVLAVLIVLAAGVGGFSGLPLLRGQVSDPAHKLAPGPNPTSPTPQRTNTSTAPVSCPVSEATLLAALQNQTGHLPKGLSLSHIGCFKGYAIATTAQPAADSEVQVYRYASGSWHYLTGGSADFCNGVPAAVRKHFRSHGYPGCL